MKVLRFKQVKEFKVEQKCKHCGAKLQIEVDDVMPNIILLGTSTPPSYSLYECPYHFVCPVCEERNDLNWANYKKYKLYRQTQKQVEENK